MSEDKDQKPAVDEGKLAEKAKKDPKSKRWNNPNSRKNLKQYQKEPIVPDIVFEEDDDADAVSQAEEITRGRKLSPTLVQKLIPKRGVLTPAERKRYTGIVVTFLADFKNEEPTASDVDDILEIAKCDTMETRLMEASKGDPGTLVAVTQSLEKIYKRKQTAKENLANRRSDRKDARASQSLNIVDLVVQYDREQESRDRHRVEELLREEAETRGELDELVKGEEF